MAEVRTENRTEERGRGLERRPQTGGLFRRGDAGLRGFNRDDLFSLSPFTLMRRLTEDMDRMFSGYGGQTSDLTTWVPPVEVREISGNLIVSAELPGMDKNDVKVEVNDNALIIQGERKCEWEENQGGVKRSERSYGVFYRAIPLPEGVKADQAKAEFNNGVLEIKIPIPEAQRTTRQIPIEGGSDKKPIGSQATGQQTQTSKAG